MNGLPSEENPYLFNGDFVDRGSFSVECILALYIYKLHNPKCMYLNRGNHEGRNMNKLYGFEGEVKAKYCSDTFNIWSFSFDRLSLCHILNKEVMVCHGGLFEVDGVTLADINNIKRNRDIPDKGLFTDMMWSDPCKEKGRVPSKRGVSI
jgi:serine/threonine-protein phosphatase 5